MSGPEAVGADVGGTKILAVAIDRRGQVIRQLRRPTPADGDAVLGAVAATVADLVGHDGTPGPVVERLGVGLPGLVDRRGVVCFAANLTDIGGWAAADELSGRLGGAVVTAANDATCAGWAEACLGAGQGRPNTLTVTIGTGIGGGIIVDGRLVTGANGFAGEFGHMVIERHGLDCPCGKRGCWERYASGGALGRLGRQAAEEGRAARIVALAGGEAEDIRGEHVTAAGAEGDPEAVAILAEFSWWLAVGLANLADAFDPECIVLGGGLVGSSGVLLGPVADAFAGLVEGGTSRPVIDVVAARLGEQAGAVGAALLAVPDIIGA